MVSPQLVVLRALLHNLIAVVQLPLDGNFELSQDPPPEMPHLEKNKSDPGKLTQPLQGTHGLNSKRGGARSGYPVLRLDSCLCRLPLKRKCTILGSQLLGFTASVSRAARHFHGQSSPLNRLCVHIKQTTRCEAALPSFSWRRRDCNFSKSGWSWLLGLQVRKIVKYSQRQSLLVRPRDC